MPTNLKKNNKITFAIKLISNKHFGFFFSFENGGGCNFIFQIMKWMDRLSESVDSRTFLPKHVLIKIANQALSFITIVYQEIG